MGSTFVEGDLSPYKIIMSKLLQLKYVEVEQRLWEWLWNINTFRRTYLDSYE